MVGGEGSGLGQLPRLKCDFCSMTFKLDLFLMLHRAKHTGETPALPCPTCKETFPSIKELTLHRKGQHPDTVVSKAQDFFASWQLKCFFLNRCIRVKFAQKYSRTRPISISMFTNILILMLLRKNTRKLIPWILALVLVISATKSLRTDPPWIIISRYVSILFSSYPSFSHFNIYSY